MNRILRYSAARYCFSALLCATSLAICIYLHVNATTAALTLLLLVLAIATTWGLTPALLVSLEGMLGFNFLFLPPIGGFTISDPQNWVALIAFVTTAFTTSHLSSRAARRTTEALQRTKEVESLYELSRAMLLDDTGESVRASVTRAASIFGIEEIRFYDLAADSLAGGGSDKLITTELMAGVARSGEPVQGPNFTVVPVRFGTRTLGSLGLSGGELAPAVRDSIASLLAINYERARALHRALAAEAARRSEAFRSSLLDGLAHDLKTPLTSIRTCVSHLIDIPPRSEETRREMLDIIDQESFRLQMTITEAIELARVESGKLNLERKDVDIAGLVASALVDARDEDQTRYRVAIPSGLTAQADPHLLRQALKQVLENAWKYTPAGSPIEVTALANDKETEISVTDHGQGIMSGELEQIFQKFYRGQRNRGLAEGTGMGLAIAKGIIEAHGGRIQAENRAGGGARFTLALPNKRL